MTLGKIKSILLIDDDQATNFLHQIVLKRAAFSGQLQICKNGLIALEYLRSIGHGPAVLPDIIFLDINMPVMDGWEFLEEYHKLPETQKAQIVLIMLTTSLNPMDYQKAMSYTEVSGFQNKPLTEEMLRGIAEKYFSD